MIFFNDPMTGIPLDPFKRLCKSENINARKGIIIVNV